MKGKTRAQEQAEQNLLILQCQDEVSGAGYFYSLCRPTYQMIERGCINCHESFKSRSPAKRICDKCKASPQRRQYDVV